MLDTFDRLLKSHCSIWKKGGTGVFDQYGHESQQFILLVDNVACWVTPRAGKELESEAAFGIQTHTFFMRPQFVDDDQRPLDIHHWLQLNRVGLFDGTERIIIDPPDAEQGQLYNIVNIKDPGMLGHHLEVQTKLIEP